MVNTADQLKTLGVYAFASPEEGASVDPNTELFVDHGQIIMPDNSPANSSEVRANLYENGTLSEKYWPGYKLDFVAYSPYTPAYDYGEYQSKGFTYDEGLLSWVTDPYHDNLRLHPTPRNGMSLYYKVPEDINQQEDLMAAYVKYQHRSPVQLEMKHLLSAIRFETGDDMPACTIKKIALANVRNAACLDVTTLAEGAPKWEMPEAPKEGDSEIVSEIKKASLKTAAYQYEFEEGLALRENELTPGKTTPGTSIIGDDKSALLLLPQAFNGKVTLFVEIDYNGYTLKKLITLDGEWLPGYTYTYRLNSTVPKIPVASLHLVDDFGMALNEIKVGYAGAETNYKVSSYIYYSNYTTGAVSKYPMPWKASIVTFDETGKEVPILWDDYMVKTSMIKQGAGKIGCVRTTYNSDGYVNGIKHNENKGVFTDHFGDIEQIEYEHYNENFVSDGIADDPVRTFVTIPKINMSKTSSATEYLRQLAEVGSEADPYNLAGRGIGVAENGLKIFHKNDGGIQSFEALKRSYDNPDEYYGKKDVNTANCYIVSEPGWYSIPLVYGCAIKDGYVNYGAYVYKPTKSGESYTSEAKSLNGTNRILQYAVNHKGDRINGPYILHENNIDATNIEAELLWEDQICLIEDVSLEKADPQKLEMYKSNGNAPSSKPTFKPLKKIKFHIKKDNIRQGNAVIALKEKDTGDVIWSWHIWVTPVGFGKASNYLPVSHNDTIYGAFYQHGHDGNYYYDQDTWEEVHNHYIYNRCIGLVMAGDKYDFTPPKNVYIKYEPMYDALEARLANQNGDLFKEIYNQHFMTLDAQGKNDFLAKIKSEEIVPFIDELKKYYGMVGTDNHGTNPVYVKVNQADLSCEVNEDYYMLYQWGRKDPMISRYEKVYDANHNLIESTDKKHLGTHNTITDHKEWITYGIKHPDEFMWDSGINGGTYYANLWNLSLGTKEINCMYPKDNKILNFYEDGNGISQNSVTQSFYYGSNRVFKSVYDPSPVGLKIPVGPVLNMLTTNSKSVTDESGQHTYYKYEFKPFFGYGRTASGNGGLFTECTKDANGNYTTAPNPHTFWIPAFGYRFGNGASVQHGNEFDLWEAAPLTSAGRGRVLHGNYSHVTVFGEAGSHFFFTMGLPILPIFDEPQWVRTW